MCTLSFKEEGYSGEFVRNYKKIAVELKSKPDTMIEVGFSLDSICASCPNHNDKVCKTQSLIDKLDNAHTDILGLKEGDILSWNSALLLIKEKMTLEKFHNACEGCEWKKFGMCEAALKELKISSLA